MRTINLETSSEISESLNLPHKKVKQFIKDNGVGSQPAGLQIVDGTNQRVVLVDRYEFEEKISGNFTLLKRKKNSKKKQTK